MPRSPQEMGEAIVRNLESRTGRSLAQWKQVARALRSPQRTPITSMSDASVTKLRDALRKRHALGGVTAHLIAWETLRPKDWKPPSEHSLVDAQYSGAKAELRPVYDRIAAAAGKLGTDVEITPRKTQVTLTRGATFGVVRAATRSRIDLGLRLPDHVGEDLEDGRLEAGDHFSGNTTHRVVLTTAKDVDAKVVKWLRVAYEARG